VAAKQQQQELKVHPAADIFPMLSDEDLADLAEDIRANGQLFPIMLDHEGRLVDGRNRLKACGIVGVKPKFETLNGHDPLAFIAGANVRRRNLTKGRQAMGLAMLYPEEHKNKGGRGKKNEAINRAETAQFSKTRLLQARTVLAYSRPMAEEVVKGNRSLDDAIKSVKEEQQRANGIDARRARLQKNAPDLFALVEEERMSLDEARAAWDKREKLRKEAYETGVEAAGKLSMITSLVASIIGGNEARNEIDPPILIERKLYDAAVQALPLLEPFCREGYLK